MLRGQVYRQASRASRPRQHRPRSRTEWCERRLAGPHSPPDGCHAAQADRAGDRRAVHALAVALAARRAGTRSRANAPRSKSCASCRDSRFRPMPGSGRSSARRIADYDPKWLDQLCLTGAVGWGRLSPHPATLEDSAAGKRRVIPTSVAPITFFVREEADWMTPHHPASGLGGSSDQPEARGLERRRAAGAGLPAPARRVVFRRHRARHRTS